MILEVCVINFHMALWFSHTVDRMCAGRLVARHPRCMWSTICSARGVRHCVNGDAVLGQSTFFTRVAGAVSAVLWWRDFWLPVNKREVAQREVNKKSCRSENESPHEQEHVLTI